MSPEEHRGGQEKLGEIGWGPFSLWAHKATGNSSFNQESRLGLTGFAQDEILGNFGGFHLDPWGFRRIKPDPKACQLKAVVFT